MTKHYLYRDSEGTVIATAAHQTARAFARGARGPWSVVRCECGAADVHDCEAVKTPDTELLAHRVKVGASWHRLDDAGRVSDATRDYIERATLSWDARV